MPSKSKAQARMMAAACHGTGTSDVPKDVACEFNRADQQTGILKGHNSKLEAKDGKVEYRCIKPEKPNW